VNSRFSAAFDRIHCAGEVRIAENEEDYAKWCIEILVKFRSNEPLQLLTGQRQSGGERSLTTILYLMSLTGLAKTPFALVDEINQVGICSASLITPSFGNGSLTTSQGHGREIRTRCTQ
jgi:chromosome segregation ATPase